MPAPIAATPANTATPVVTAKPVAPVAPRPAAPVATAPAPAADDGIELTIKGATKKYTRDEIQKLAGKSAYADQLLRQTKEALAERAKEKEEREREKMTASERAKADTDAWLREHGVDPDEYARGKLSKKISEQEMTPEQRAIAERDAEIARLKKESDARTAAEKKTKDAQAQKAIQQQMENSLADAAERAGFAKGDADAFFAIYEAVKEFHRLGLPFDADRIVDTARENIDSSFDRLRQSVSKGLKGKALVDKLGEDVVKEVLRYRAELLRNGGRPAPAPPAANGQKPNDGNGFVSVSDLQQRYREGHR